MTEAPRTVLDLLAAMIGDPQRHRFPETVEISRNHAAELIAGLRYTTNGCEQALLLLERAAFKDVPEVMVLRAVLRGALAQVAPLLADAPEKIGP